MARRHEGGAGNSSKLPLDAEKERNLARHLGTTRLLLSLTATLLLSCAPAQESSRLPLFDTRHVDGAIAYFSAPTEDGLLEIAETAAARHLLEHSAVTGYYPPGATSLDITRDLLGGPVEPTDISRVEELLAGIEAMPEGQRSCLAEAANHLPEEFHFAEPLHVTWGYDIGVSMNGSASINLAHPRFAADPEEVWYYCTHEMHHAGLTTFQPFPIAIPQIQTTAQMATSICVKDLAGNIRVVAQGANEYIACIPKRRSFARMRHVEE